MKPRRVLVFTGSRAEFGLLSPVVEALGAEPGLECGLLVARVPEASERERQQQEIAAAGFPIAAEFALSPARGSTARAIGAAVVSASACLEQSPPDFFLVYGDRFEAFAAAIAATQTNVPTAHVEGGDLTEGGALDDSVRHAISKLAHLHFPTNADAATRLRAMGEEDWRIETVGLPALDWIRRGDYASPEVVAERLALDLDRPIVLFTQHSITTCAERARDQVGESIEALRVLAREGAQIVMTHPNADRGGEEIVAGLRAFAAEGHAGVSIHPSLGRALYHGVLALARSSPRAGDPGRRVVCAGNSSSGLKETPSFGCPAVDVGARQAGRLRADNVVSAPCESTEILAAIRGALFDDTFRARCARAKNPYGDGDAGPRIARRLASLACDRETLLCKRFAASEPPS